MKAKPISQQRSSAGAVTTQHDYCPASPFGECLFSVRGGIPLVDAFDQLSIYVETTRESVEHCAMASKDVDDVPSLLWQSSYLLVHVEALVHAMHQGLMDHEKRQ